jgi:hypothetical protein
MLHRALRRPSTVKVANLCTLSFPKELQINIQPHQPRCTMTTDMFANDQASLELDLRTNLGWGNRVGILGLSSTISTPSPTPVTGIILGATQFSQHGVDEESFTEYRTGSADNTPYPTIAQ